MTDCVHHWLIDELQVGICKKCQERKEFPIKVEEWSHWEDSYKLGGNAAKFAWSKENVW